MKGGIRLKLFKSPPLPFRGNKRYAVSLLIDYFKNVDIKQDCIIDLFGGSGLLSHVFKYMYPEKRVIYNDYDYYTDRIKVIPDTNQRLARIRELISDVKPEQQIKDDYAISEIRKILSGALDKHTVSSSVTFRNTKYRADRNLYNFARKSDYKIQDGYLDGLEIVHKDYRELLGRDAFYILDPPYCGTDQEGYGKGQTVTEFLELLGYMKDIDSFIFFSSYKSISGQILEYFYDIDRVNIKSAVGNTEWFYLVNGGGLKAKDKTARLAR